MRSPDRPTPIFACIQDSKEIDLQLAESVTMSRSDHSWTNVVKGTRSNSHLVKTGCDISRSVCMQGGQPQLEWPTYQENGQRKYGPPKWWIGPPPPKGTEVFLSRLHRQVMEDELCPILATVGNIYTFRLMMDFSGSNRGYGFVQYSTREEALRAIKELHDYPIRPGSKMTVEESMDNCRLFMGHIPKDLNETKMMKLLGKYMSGLKQVIMYMSPLNPKENRGFCFVEFEDHRSAAMGRRYLLCSGVPEWRNIDAKVDWAVPELQLPKDIMEQVTAIYMRNLLITTSEDRIKALLESITINMKFIAKIKKVKDFAFIHFTNRQVAEYALDHLDGVSVDGAIVSVCWAKPPEFKYKGEYYYVGSFPDSLRDTPNSSRRESLGSVQGDSSDSGYSSVLRGVPLIKRKDKMYRNKSQFKIDRGFTNDSLGSCSPMSLSPCGYNDDNFVTDRCVTPTNRVHNYNHFSQPFVTSTPSYQALVKSVLPASPKKSFFLDTSKIDDSFDVNYNVILHKSSPISGDGSIIETEEYKSLKAVVSKLLRKDSHCAYEVLKLIAKEHDWGTVFYHPLELNGGWIVSIRLLKGSSTKTLVDLDTLCKTVEDALNTAASKFFREYILDPRMFPTAKILFFP
ncbi:hypothetical protein GE061_013725 [Apolygus lucorum]|uniref:RRM domain-containing protein n=1 Tax=Apolygus lucorum TaxID=248454 RepID=A0A8S9XQU3_APOLU|nr:hypothetical protein GE061_013725 [Apolygus lucorum]